MSPITDDKNEKLADTGFISEKIKQRPINRKKLLRRTLITFFLAIVFGIVACFTFLFLQPVFSDRLYPEAEPEPVSFPEENIQDELTPEEMLAVETAQAESEAQSIEASQKDQIDEATKKHRQEIIMEQQQIIMADHAKTMIGKKINVLCEGFDRYAECFFGRSSADAPEVDGKVFFVAKEEQPKIGDIVRVDITDTLDCDIMGFCSD